MGEWRAGQGCAPDVQSADALADRAVARRGRYLDRGRVIRRGIGPWTHPSVGVRTVDGAHPRGRRWHRGMTGSLVRPDGSDRPAHGGPAIALVATTAAKPMTDRHAVRSARALVRRSGERARPRRSSRARVGPVWADRPLAPAGCPMARWTGPVAPVLDSCGPKGNPSTTHRRVSHTRAAPRGGAVRQQMPTGPQVRKLAEVQPHRRFPHHAVRLDAPAA